MVAKSPTSGRLRIIGGAWRSRRLSFPDRVGLRPTPDRVRETVFNWLAPYLSGAHCLDLFAGSGALGFEALSRGAAQVIFVEQDRDACAAIETNVALLGTPAARVVQAEALTYLSGAPHPVDIVFLDPPYASALLEPASRLLQDRGWLKPHSFIYLESPAAQSPSLPPHWELLRSKRAGQVGYHLARFADTRKEQA